ncbi:hypothetical protein BB558_000612 [Smittium angustum]|uniref:beta-N-acetylhexosaminidase n=1 Tax=Smittium angustum TaxID=133377 RepID=A0A2U1JE07_SMIAN|nr:hypothetical protein BB558_000612 [Smittium angustum]
MMNRYGNSREINEIIENMTLRDKVFQKIIPSFKYWKNTNRNQWNDIQNTVLPLTQINAQVAGMLRSYNFCGINLENENVISATQATTFTYELQKANLISNPVPLLIVSTKGGGSRENRISLGSIGPGNMAIGAAMNETYASLCSQYAASEIGSIGVKLNLGLSCDVNSDPTNPSAGVSSFSMDPDEVTKLSFEAMRGVQSMHVACSAKHFPGGGDVVKDPDSGFSVCSKNTTQLEKTELQPFFGLIGNGMDVVVASHIQVPSLDDTAIPNDINGTMVVVPASLSKTIVTEKLRTQMGFNGVVISQEIDVPEMRDNFNVENIVSMAFKAGVDIINLPTEIVNLTQTTIFDTIYSKISSEIQSGNYTMDELDSSVRRIMAFKNKYGVFRITTGGLQQRIDQSIRVFGRQESLDLQNIVCRESITVVKNYNGIGIPFSNDNSNNVLVFMPDQKQCDSVQKTVKSSGINGNFKFFAYQDMVYNSTWDSVINGCTHVVVGSQVGVNNPPNDGVNILKDDQDPNNSKYCFPLKVVDACSSANKLVSVISLDSPYDIANFENADSIICAYGAEGLDSDGNQGPNISAAIQTVFGKSEPKGKLPTDVMDPIDKTKVVYTKGTGLRISASKAILIIKTPKASKTIPISKISKTPKAIPISKTLKASKPILIT